MVRRAVLLALGELYRCRVGRCVRPVGDRVVARGASPNVRIVKLAVATCAYRFVAAVVGFGRRSACVIVRAADLVDMMLDCACSQRVCRAVATLDRLRNIVRVEA